jgi:uncharacterized protein (DUF488 family)
MPRYNLFTIGHSNISSERFIAMLRDAEVNAIADVRSVPNSRWCPWFSAKALAESLPRAGITYATMGDTLGGRPRDARLFRDGVVDYEAMAVQPEFVVSLDRLTEDTARSRICLMCSEREPLECHRCLLVARSLAERGLAVGHILHDGTIEPHAATEARLLALCGGGDDLFVTGQDERLGAAYRRRVRAVAYRVKARANGANVVAEAR